MGSWYAPILLRLLYIVIREIFEHFKDDEEKAVKDVLNTVDKAVKAHTSQ